MTKRTGTPVSSSPTRLIRSQVSFIRNQRTRACPGGLWIVHADLFNAHRMDERFEGWGCEDTEFLRRIPWRRLPGPLFHIWHAKASKEALGRNRRLLRNALMKG